MFSSSSSVKASFFMMVPKEAHALQARFQGTCTSGNGGLRRSQAPNHTMGLNAEPENAKR